MSADLAPIILFVYNRPHHTRQTIESLQQCRLAAQSVLHIFADGPKSQADAVTVAEVRSYIRQVSGFKEVKIHERNSNQGLANSVIAGVTEVINQSGKAIVLEDDLLFSVDFLTFMNDALRAYEHHSRIFSISGYSYPLSLPATFTDAVYLLPRASSWGWATWADRWAKADWEVSDYPDFLQNSTLRRGFAEGGEDLVYMLKKQQLGKVNSWAVRWSYTHYKNQAYGLFPRQSKVQNTGNDQSGTHSPKTNRFRTTVGEAAYTLPPEPVLHPVIVAKLQPFFRPSILRKIINYFTLG